MIGELTPEKLEILRNADAIFREEMDRHGVRADQYFAVLTNTHSVGVVGDFRTYDYTIALRAVKTSDFMTCEYVPVPHEVLGICSARIVNEVRGARPRRLRHHRKTPGNHRVGIRNCPGKCCAL